MMRHLLHFPCRDAVFDWFAASSGSGIPPVTIDLLVEQREFERQPANRDKRVTCQACADPDARYVACRCRGPNNDKLFLRRFPGSQHKPGCFSYSAELDEITEALNLDKSKVVRPGGDFSALRRALNDPEFDIVAMRLRSREHPSRNPRSSSRATARMTVGLQRLAKELLQRSGMCEWHPAFEGRRDERVFNGRVKGAITELLVSADGPAAELLRSLSDIHFVPWSFLSPNDPKTPASMTKCVGFGFIEGLGPENEHGAREMTLRNHPDCPVVVPRRILDREGKNRRSALLSFLAHPTWCIFVAGQYEGVWKAHALVAFRLSDTALIPVESLPENSMAEHFATLGRHYKRWLLPPPEFITRKIIPDFQLLDTKAKHYAEAGGRMGEAGYASKMDRKRTIVGPRLLVWDTETPLDRFELPAADASENAKIPGFEGAVLNRGSMKTNKSIRPTRTGFNSAAEVEAS